MDVRRSFWRARIFCRRASARARASDAASACASMLEPSSQERAQQCPRQRERGREPDSAARWWRARGRESGRIGEPYSREGVAVCVAKIARSERACTGRVGRRDELLGAIVFDRRAERAHLYMRACGGACAHTPPLAEVSRCALHRFRSRAHETRRGHRAFKARIVVIPVSIGCGLCVALSQHLLCARDRAAPPRRHARDA